MVQIPGSTSNNADDGFRVECINPWIDPNTIYVDLLSSIDGYNWLPVHVAGGTETVFKVSENGYFDAGVGVIPNAQDNSSVSFRLRAWGEGASYETARDCDSVTWTQTVGSWDPNSGLPATGLGLYMPRQLDLEAPEPSTLTLVLLGGGLTWGFRLLRRGTKSQQV